jgi:hypothetical protein
MGSKPWCGRAELGEPGGLAEGDECALRIAEIPGQAVEVAEDMTGGAGEISVSRAQLGVVEDAPPVADVCRAGIVCARTGYADRGDRGARPRVDRRDRIGEALHHVQPPAAAVQRQAARTSSHRDAIQDLAGPPIEDAQLLRPERRQVVLASPAAKDPVAGEREAPGDLLGRAG